MAFFKKKTAPEVPNEPMDVDAVMKKYDRESNTRVWEGVPKWIVTSILAVFSLFCIYVTFFATFNVIYGIYRIYRIPCFPCKKRYAKSKLYALVRYCTYGAWYRCLFILLL